MLTSLLVFCVFLHQILAVDNNCDSNKCYQTVNNSHENLRKLINGFKKTVSEAKVPKVYNLEDINPDIKEAEKIRKDVNTRSSDLSKYAPKLDQTDSKTGKQQETVTLMLEKLSNISQYQTEATNLANEAAKYQKNLEKNLELATNASETCLKAHDQFSRLKKTEDEIKDLHEKNKKVFGDLVGKVRKLNEKIQKTFEETLTDRKDFDKLELPVNLVDTFLLSAETDFNRTINVLKENSEILKELLSANWTQKLINYLEKNLNLTAIVDVVAKMDKALMDYKKEFKTPDDNLPIDAEARTLLDYIKTNLTLLETYLGKNYTKEDMDVLRNNSKDDKRKLQEVRQNTKLIKDYMLLLDSLPADDEKIKRIEEEIATLRNTILLYEKWRKLKKDFKQLEVHHDAIVKVNCTAVKVVVPGV